jgi:hypothetical protein
VLGEVVSKTIGAGDLDLVFPGARVTPNGFLRLV